MKPDKKEQILAKAMELFFDRGVTAVSMDDIAAAVPVAKMTIYKYFQSKDRLVGAVMERYVREQHDIMNRKIAESPDTLAALVSILDYREIAVVPDLFIRESVAQYPQIVTELLNYYQVHIHEQLRDLIVKGQEEGVIRRELSPHILMVYMEGLTEFFARPDVVEQFQDLRLLGEQFRTMFLFGIAAPQNRSDDASHNAWQDKPRDSSQDPPQDTPQDSSQDPPQGPLKEE